MTEAPHILTERQYYHRCLRCILFCSIFLQCLFPPSPPDIMFSSFLKLRIDLVQFFLSFSFLFWTRGFESTSFWMATSCRLASRQGFKRTRSRARATWPLTVVKTILLLFRARTRTQIRRFSSWPFPSRERLPLPHFSITISVVGFPKFLPIHISGNSPNL